jgi:hypothetical protein
MISKIRVILAYMKKRTLPKKEDVFSYKELADEMWRESWSKAEKQFNTSFDWENNDSTGQKRVINFVDDSDPDIDFHYKFNCDLWSAGGDWEYPCYYFKCQIIDGSTQTYDEDILPFPGPIGQYRDSHFILIPPKDGGNTRLQKSDKGKWMASQNSDTKDKDVPELDSKKAWNWLEEYLKNYIDAYFKNKASHK